MFAYNSSFIFRSHNSEAVKNILLEFQMPQFVKLSFLSLEDLPQINIDPL